jgi:hypothetical protein
MRLHRLECTHACDCARRRCGRCHHVRAGLRPLVYIFNAYIMYIYVYIYRCKVRGCKWVRVSGILHTRAIASGCRRCAHTRHVCDATRSLRKAIHRWNTHIHRIRILDACMHPHPCAAGCPDARVTDERPLHTRAHVLRPCGRVCACAIGRARIRADTSERVPPAWTAGGSARRRSKTRRRSTRTSARGTPRQSSRCRGYAPPFRPGRRAAARRDALGGSSMRRGAAVGTRMCGCPRV